MNLPELIKLTNRELEILCLMAKGQNNIQISSDLDIAESTVRFHVSNIVTKMGVGDRTQAVIKAVNCGIVDL